VGQIADADGLINREAGNIDIDVAGDLAGQALDFDFAHDLIEDAAVVLDAYGDTDHANWNADLHRLIESDALEVDVQQAVADGLVLPVDDHDLGNAFAGNVHVKQRVVARLGVQDPQNLLGVELDGDGGLSGAVDDGGNLASYANATCCIFVELALTGLCNNDFRHVTLSCPSPTWGSDSGTDGRSRSLCARPSPFGGLGRGFERLRDGNLWLAEDD
jgi:hypothetical protein